MTRSGFGRKFHGPNLSKLDFFHILKIHYTLEVIIIYFLKIIN